MQLTLLLGSILQVFGPAAAVVTLLLLRNPPLMIIATFGAFVALAPLLCTGLVFTCIAAAGGHDVVALGAGAVAAGNDQRVALLMMGLIFQELFRFLMARAVTSADWHFRTRSQVLCSSRFRVIPCGVALGVGFGFTRTVLTYGALVDAHVAVLDGDTDATYYDFDACPQLPYLYFQALAALFELVAQVSWTVLATSAAASMNERRTAVAVAAKAMDAPADDEPRRPIPRATTVRPVEAIGLFGIVAVLHLAFSAAALLNTAGYDEVAMQPTGHGCNASLPVQCTLAVVSVALALALAKFDVVKRISDIDI
jgi:hypothetical protein